MNASVVLALLELWWTVLSSREHSWKSGGQILSFLGCFKKGSLTTAVGKMSAGRRLLSRNCGGAAAALGLPKFWTEPAALLQRESNSVIFGMF